MNSYIKSLVKPPNQNYLLLQVIQWIYLTSIIKIYNTICSILLGFIDETQEIQVLLPCCRKTSKTAKHKNQACWDNTV